MDRFRVAFNIGPWAVSKYALLAVVGFIIVFITIMIQAKRRRYPIKPLEHFAIIAIVLSIIGARVWFLVGHSSTVTNFWAIFAVWRGGVAIEGAALFVAVGSFFYFWHIKKKYGVSMWKYFDIIAPNVFLFQAIGRWGNFFNQEILGPPMNANGWFFKHIPRFIRSHLVLRGGGYPIVYRQPFFLYESIICFWLWLFLLLTVQGVEPQAKKRNKKIAVKMKKIALLNKIARGNDRKKNVIVLTQIQHEKFQIRKIQKPTALKYSRWKIHVAFGNKAVLWFLLYGILRTIMEPFRDQQDILMLGKLQLSTFTSAVIVVIATIVFALNQNIIKWRWWRLEVRRK